MPPLLVARDGPVVRVTLNRPELRNALDDQLVLALTTWATDAARDPAIRAVVISGAGKAFCAGADLAWMSRAFTSSRDDNLREARAIANMFECLNTLPVPVIGRIHGVALGGGVGLAAICDIVVAAEDATFGFAEVKLGILPAVIAPYALAKIGTSHARHLFLTGVRFSAAEAQVVGLVHRVAPAADLERHVSSYLDEILSSGPTAIAAAKALIAEVSGRRPADVTPLTSETIARHRTSEEGQEGMRAFLEKRRPRWHGR